MKIVEAVEKARENEKVKEIIQSDYFCSAFVILGKGEELSDKNWKLGFYSEEENEITSVEAGETVKINETGEPLKKNTTELDIGKVKISAEEALEKAKTHMKEKFDSSYKKILFSLKTEEDEQICSATFVGSTLTIISVSIDSESGKIKSSKKESMMKEGPSSAS